MPLQVFHRAVFSLAVLIGLSAATARASADPFVGVFTTEPGADAALRLTIKSADKPASYTGSIEKSGQTYSLAVSEDPQNAGRLAGSFTADGQQYPLELLRDGDKVKLNSGQLHFVLQPSGKALAPPVHADAAKVLKFVPSKIVDQDMKIDAMSLLAPEGWKVRGQVSWIPAGAGLAVFYVDVQDPDSHAMARFYPTISYTDGVRESQIRADMAQTGGRMRRFYEQQLAEGNVDGAGAEIRHIPASPAEYVQNFVLPRLRPDMKDAADLKLVEQKDLPDYAAKIASQTPNAQAVSSRIRLSYTLANQNMEEMFVCTLVRLPIGVGPMAWSSWFAEVDSYQAPAGVLDAKLPTLLAVRESTTVELPWFNLYSQIGEQLVNIEKDKLQRMIHDTAVRMDTLHALANQAQRDVSDQIHDRFEKQQAAKADAHDHFMDYVNDLQKVQNPLTGQTMKVPSGYSHAYEGSNGAVIVTNDPSYQPAPGWTRLQAAK